MPSGSATPLPQRVKQFYERVSYDREGALHELASIYAPDVHFENPVVDERGLDKFEAQWLEAFSMYKVFKFEHLEVCGDDSLFSLRYEMDIRFSVGPHFRTEMATVCWGKDGLVTRVHDYFDPLGSLLGPSRLLTAGYRMIFRMLVA